MGLFRHAFAIDDATEAAMEQDRALLSAQLNTSLTVSQYLRFILNQRLQHQDPHAAGWREGALLAYGKFRESLEQTFHNLTDGDEGPPR